MRFGVDFAAQAPHKVIAPALEGQPAGPASQTRWRWPNQPYPGTQLYCYRCSLPGLAGFTANCRGGTNWATIYDHQTDVTPSRPTPRRAINYQSAPKRPQGLRIIAIWNKFSSVILPVAQSELLIQHTAAVYRHSTRREITCSTSLIL